MKNKLYYIVFPVYAAVVVFILYINGVFSSTEVSYVNLLINVGFLVIIGILFLISAVSFARLNRCTDELVDMSLRLQDECREAGGKNLWPQYQDRRDVFKDNELNNAFVKYRLRMKNYKTKRGYVGTCDIDEYINEDLIDRVGMNYYNASIAGTMTGLGILGTFLGLSMGLGSFNGDDIYTISDNVGPLLTGMKVAFHTSVYGIFFSLIFTYVYRCIMSDAYEKLENFQNAFKQFAQPQVATEDENSAAMVIYQASMANAMKQILELLKGSSAEQTAGVEQIVNRFTEQMTNTMGINFQKLGNALRTATEAQKSAADSSRELVEAASALVEVNRNMQDVLSGVLERQERYAGELAEQKEMLSAACNEMTGEISNQLYAFEQMRNLYEK